MKPGRLQAFSDGVFAILITILVLEFHVPTYRTGHLWTAVLHQWPILFAYIISFLYVGTLWLFHHDYFNTIARIDRGLNFVNLVVLFPITLVDYPTNLIASALASGNQSDMKTAFIIYDVVALLISASFKLLYVYVNRHATLRLKQVKHTQLHQKTKDDPLRSVAIYAMALVVTPFSTWLGALLLLGGIIFHTVAYFRLSHSTKIVVD